MRIKHQLGGGYLLATSGVTLALLVGLMLFAPSISQPEASATENNSNATTTATENNPGISTYSTTPSVGISLPTSIDFADVLPTPSGATTTATANLTVTTTDSAGYRLYLYSSDGDNSLRPKNSSLANISKINATAGGVGLTLSSLKPNTWGYNLGTTAPTDATTYSAVPANNSTPIQTKDTSDTNSANDTYALSFGAKVDTTTASGAYSDTLTIAVVAEPPYIPAFDGITTMQEMTSTICANAEENETTRLTDTRDGKQYWVAKLKDGNCWMTQNLDLDLTNGVELTPDDSDISSNWNPPRTTEKNGDVTFDSNNTETYSWDFGLYVKNNPDDYDSYCSQVKTMSGCKGWTDATNLTPAEIEWTGSVDNTVSGNTYDAHFLIGNFYQWNAATAGTGGTIDNFAKATDSICPKGWRLPTSRSGGEFDTLVGDLDSTTITQAPYYFHPSGNVYSGSLRLAGYKGDYWSSTAYSSASYAYYLSFRSGDVRPSDYNYRYVGRSVRCLAR